MVMGRSVSRMLLEMSGDGWRLPCPPAEDWASGRTSIMHWMVSGRDGEQRRASMAQRPLKLTETLQRPRLLPGAPKPHTTDRPTQSISFGCITYLAAVRKAKDKSPYVQRYEWPEGDFLCSRGDVSERPIFCHR